MKTVKVSCGKEYEILIGKGLMKNAFSLVSDRFGYRKTCVVCDSNVEKIHLEKFLLSFPEKPEVFVFKAGEENKTLKTVTELVTFLTKKHFTRTDMLIALGGGITGDITGFAAAVYMRGIEYIQVPTTLLAMVDSSVGGKTGVNVAGYKNQAGAFLQPSLVITDTETLETLPFVEYSSGMAEVIKYAALYDEKMGNDIENDTDIESIIEKCVTIKKDVVTKDEKDTGERQMLNFGHTFGHGIEKVSKNFYTHGQAVAIGMVMAFKTAENLGMCRKPERLRLEKLLDKFKLPKECNLNKKSIFSAMKNDKKIANGHLNLILPQKFGKCVIYNTTPDMFENIFYEI